MDQQENEEVKELFTDDEELITPESLAKEVEETPTESSPEKKPDEEPVVEEKSETPEVPAEEPIEEPEPVGPKPVEGETPRERALRFEVERLRKVNKEKKKTEFFKEEEQPKVEEPAKEEVDLSGYNQDELSNFDKLMGVYAKKHGFVTKGDKSEVLDEVLDDFIENHPEYDSKNDPDNLLWDKFRSEYSIYKRPNNPKDFKKLLEKVNLEVVGNSKIDPAIVAAQQTKLKTAAHGGTTTAKVTKENSISPEMRPYLIGFTDEDLE
jgi:hypothetical protein